jgi:hydrogenase maturation protein HypF
MAEHGLDEAVIGVAFDSSGLGTDGHFWGAEFFVGDLLTAERAGRFEYLPMPGGDRVASEPFRMGLSYLYHEYGDDVFGLDLDFVRRLPEAVKGLLVTAMKHRVNSPLCSSAGRLFDAVSAITGLCNISSFHGEAAMRLYALIDPSCSARYDYEAGPVIRFGPMIRQIVKDKQLGISNAVISTKFHNTIIAVIEDGVERIRRERGLAKVVLGGGVFHNRYILERLENSLAEKGFQVYTHEKVPANGGGIALGQLIIAGKMREKGF